MTVASGNARLVVNWVAVGNATGYKVQWKSGGQSYNTGTRQATITSGTTTSHTILSLTNGTEYTVRVTATRTGANDGPSSDEEMGTPGAAGVTVSESALTVTEQNATGGTYTVVLDTRPTANVTVTVAGHAGTDVTLTPSSGTLTFTTTNWSTARTVTVKAGNDADTTNDTVTLTHSATSTDPGYGGGVTIGSVVVTVTDNDTARVTGVTVTSGNARLVVNWVAVGNATGYKVQWKSGGQSYNTGNRQFMVTSGSTTSRTIPSLTNGTEYTVRVTATPDRRQRRPALCGSDGDAGGGDRGGRHGVDDGADGDGGEHDRGHLHGGSRYPADGECDGNGRRARGHGRDPDPCEPDLHDDKLEHGADGDGEGRQRYGHDKR